jgi:pimeloyl-ACP methyl ester carboxylesterase
MNISAFYLRKAILGTLIMISVAAIQSVSAEQTYSGPDWISALKKQKLSGKVQDLPLKSKDAAQNTFFSLYLPHSGKKRRGGIILLHSAGAHPDWRQVINPLRTGLPDRGWATLSIALPSTADHNQVTDSLTSSLNSALPRIEAAMDFLRSQSYADIVVIGHGLGSLMALNFLQVNADTQTKDKRPVINAAVLISVSARGKDIPLNDAGMIEKIKIPLLDIYGSRDIVQVRNDGKLRKSAALKAANKMYRQYQMIGADHFFQGLENELNLYIHYWLKKVLKQ